MVTTKDPIQMDCRARTFRILRIGTATIRITLMTAVRVVLPFVTAQELVSLTKLSSAMLRLGQMLLAEDYRGLVALGW